MQTLNLTIPGSYYDSQIYSGRLYLWSDDGSIVTLDWDKLVEGIGVSEPLKLALTCAFQMSEYLYGDHWKLVFQDTEIKTTIQRKFQELANKSPLEISSKELQDNRIHQQDNPLSFPHADCTIYGRTLYLGSQSGLSAASCGHETKNPISPKPKKLWDGSVLSLSASYSTLAIAAGNAGLFEYDLDGVNTELKRREPHRVKEQQSNFVRWLFASVFSSSYLNEGFLADYSNQENSDDEEGRRERKLREIIPSSKIFGHPTKNGGTSLTWGVHDKICFAIPKSIEVVQYAPYKEKEDERLIKLGEISIKEPIGDIVSGDSALFGFVIESDDGLLVINSQQESMWIAGEPVNWRVFPKSKFYTNQLHVIYDDHLCIYSFNEDYFVDQKTKKIGIRHRSEFPFGGRRI